jgi:hypothetical protein
VMPNFEKRLRECVDNKGHHIPMNPGGSRWV